MQHQLCKNCQHTFEGNFCSNCGQKTSTKRLDWHYLFDELKYTFLHINGGLLFTCKQLLTRPGHMTREFIEGKRIKHYKPILLVFVLAGISTLLLYYSGDLIIMEKMQSTNKSVFDPKDFVSFFSKCYTYIQLASIPFFSICTWFAFKKWGYNYIENTIINSFVIAQMLIIGILFTPVKYLLIGNSFNVKIFIVISFISYGFPIWLYLQLYKDKKIKHIILRMLLTFLFLVTTLLVVTIVGVLVGVMIGIFGKH